MKYILRVTYWAEASGDEDGGGGCTATATEDAAIGDNNEALVIKSQLQLGLCSKSWIRREVQCRNNGWWASTWQSRAKLLWTWVRIKLASPRNIQALSFEELETCLSHSFHSCTHSHPGIIFAPPLLKAVTSFLNPEYTLQAGTIGAETFRARAAFFSPGTYRDHQNKEMRVQLKISTQNRATSYLFSFDVYLFDLGVLILGKLPHGGFEGDRRLQDFITAYHKW